MAVRFAAQAERPRADPAQPTRVGPAGKHGTRGGERPRAGLRDQFTGGQADRRRQRGANASSDQPCGFDSRSFRHGPVVYGLGRRFLTPAERCSYQVRVITYTLVGVWGRQAAPRISL